MYVSLARKQPKASWEKSSRVSGWTRSRARGPQTPTQHVAEVMSRMWTSAGAWRSSRSRSAQGLAPTSATQQPKVAGTNLLAGRTAETADAVPYFWSDQNRARIQFAGRHRDGDTVRITEGELSDGAPAEGGFPARYERDGTTAVVAVDRPCPFMRARRELARGAGEGRAQSALR